MEWLRKIIGVMQRLKTLRLDENITQVELAAAARVTQSTISQLENGRRSPRPNTLRRIAEVLGTTSETLAPELAAEYYPRPSKLDFSHSRRVANRVG